MVLIWPRSCQLGFFHENDHRPSLVFFLVNLSYKTTNVEGFIFFYFFKLVMLSQSLRNPIDQLKTPLNPAGFRLTLAPNFSRPIIPSRQATALRSGLLDGIRWAGCVQALRRWITRTAPHRWIVGRSVRGDPIGCARLLAHHWLLEKKRCYWAQKETKLWLGRRIASFFFCIVCSVFCERAGSVFLHRLKSIDIA